MDDVYDDGGQSQAPKAVASDDTTKEDEGQQTTLIPKSLCPDMNVGDEVVLKIVAGHENDWEVEYAPKSEGKEEGEEKGAAPAMMGDSDYD